MATPGSFARNLGRTGARTIAKENFADQPLKQRIATLKLIEQDYVTRSQLMDIDLNTYAPIRDSDVGLIMRQSFNDAQRREQSTENDLAILRKRIRKLEVKLHNSERREKTWKRCWSPMDAAQRVLGYLDAKKGADDDEAKLTDHRALEETVTIVWELYKGANVKKEEVKGSKRRKTGNTKR